MDHPSPDQRRRHWDGVYEGKPDTETSWFQSRPEVSLELIDETGLGASARVIEVGGGASRLVDHLIDRGLDVTVLDVSPEALARSRRRLGDRADQVRWIEADITASRVDGAFDLWHDRAVFHFLIDAQDRQKYCTAMTAAVVPGGYGIIATFAEDGPTHCSGLPVRRYSEKGLARELGPTFRLVGARNELHRTPDGRRQAFVYCMFRKRYHEHA